MQSLNINMLFCCFFCVCLHVSLYVSNHFNHCIKLFAPCGTQVDNKNSYSYSILLYRVSLVNSRDLVGHNIVMAARTDQNISV